MSTDSTDVSIKNFEVQNLNNCPENKNYEECIKLQQLLMDGDTNIAFTTNFGSITLSNIVMNNIYFSMYSNYLFINLLLFNSSFYLFINY